MRTCRICITWHPAPRCRQRPFHTSSSGLGCCTTSVASGCWQREHCRLQCLAFNKARASRSSLGQRRPLAASRNFRPTSMRSSTTRTPSSGRRQASPSLPLPSAKAPRRTVRRRRRRPGQGHRGRGRCSGFGEGLGWSSPWRAPTPTWASSAGAGWLSCAAPARRRKRRQRRRASLSRLSPSRPGAGRRTWSCGSFMPVAEITNGQR
mmetsp:Transcript_83827/g.235623  ORF Transcript_83827/g.235623 Transcript_83827/m.235623 type:complete len:207 (+) Transcript_83827:1-621(+)